jgi:hypothetical protein
LSSTTLPLRLHLQANGTCGLLQFVCSSCYMFHCNLFPFILLFNASSMFELHVIVAGIVMFNILELTIEIVPNCPTFTSCATGMVGFFQKTRN